MFSFVLKTSVDDMLYIARVSEFDNMKLRQHEPG